MEIKRYEPCYNGNGDPAMAESPNGKYYSRADLIAAGCLVPVTDGEAVRLKRLGHFQPILLDGQVLVSWIGADECDCLFSLDGSPAPDYETNMYRRVQPVRLVRLDGVG